MGDGFVLVWFKPNSKLPSWNFRFLPTSGSRPPHRFSWIDRSRHAAGCRQASRTAALAPFSENPPPSHKQSSPVHAPEMQCARARRPPRRVGQRIIERDTRRPAPSPYAMQQRRARRHDGIHGRASPRRLKRKQDRHRCKCRPSRSSHRLRPRVMSDPVTVEPSPACQPALRTLHTTQKIANTCIHICTRACLHALTCKHKVRKPPRLHTPEE